MARAEPSIHLARYLARRLYPLTIAVALLLGTVPPTLYYRINSATLAEDATDDARLLAEKLQTLVLDNPALWKFSAQKYGQLLRDFLIMEEGEAVEIEWIRVLDERGRPIEGYSHTRVAAPERWAVRPVVTTAQIVFNNRVWGSVEVAISRATLIRTTTWWAIVCAVAGTGLAVLVHAVPVRVIGRAERRIDQLVERLTRLGELGRLLSETHDPDVVARQIAQHITALLGATGAAVYRLVAGSGELQQVAFAGDRPPENMAAAEAAARERGAVITDELSPDPSTDASRRGDRAASSVLVIPLTARDRVIGALAVRGAAGRRFSDEDVRLAQTFADQAGLALHNAELFHDVSVQATHIRAAADLGRTLVAITDRDRVIDLVMACTNAALGTPCVGAYLHDPESGLLQFRPGPTSPTGFVWSESLAPGEGLAGRCMIDGRPAWSADILHDPALHFSAAVRAHIERTGSAAVLAAPLVRDRTLGALVVWQPVGHRFSDEEVDCAVTFANQLAAALENVQLFNEVTARAGRLRSLAEIGRDLVSLRDVAAIVDVLSAHARRALDTPCVGLCLVQPSSGGLQVRLASVTAEGDAVDHHVERGDGLPGRAIEERRPVTTAEVPGDRALPVSLSGGIGLEPGASFTGLAVPLGAEHPTGAIVVYRPGYRAFSGEETEYVSAIAGHVAAIVDNTRLFCEIEQRRHTAESLAAVGQVVAQSLDPAEVATRIVESLKLLFHASVTALYRTQPDSDEFVLLAGLGVETEAGRLSPRQSGLVGLAVRDRKTATTPDVLTDARIELGPDAREHIERSQYRAGLAVPLLVKGQVIGGLLVGAGPERVFDDQDIRVAEAFATHAALALENARLFAATEAQAAALARKNAELDSFVYSASHDLKAPLVTIQGMTGILLEDYGDRLDNDGRHYLERLEANTRHMERLILDLLALSRIGREGASAKSVNVAEMVTELLDGFDGTIRERGVSVTVHPLPTLWAIPTQIEQVFANLIGNALKYLGDGAAPTVEIGATGNGDMTECYVTDSGVGIDPAYHAKVFEVFQRLRDVEAEGTGVGLAIVKKIVESNGGCIWVESAKGAGATFRFTWPKPLSS